jgi:hypothetical protein
MDKLEEYLDQVCRGIGGGRALRQHLREELRQHLRDAAAEHKAAGLSDEEALNRALEHFGGPDEVRSELEATHGHRLLGVVIDKALQWKERTMKAKWLWMSWAHIALIGVVVAEALYISFCQVFLVPKFFHIDSHLHDPALRQSDASWLYDCLGWVNFLANSATKHWWILLAVAVLWALFEWRVRSEHKTFMRLSALGTAALALFVGVVLTTGSMVILLMLGIPAPLATDHLVRQANRVIEESMRNFKQDFLSWDIAEANVERAAHAFHLVDTLAKEGDAQKPPEAIAPHLASAQEALREARQAITARDAPRLKTSLGRFREAYEPVRQWTAENKLQR